MSPSTWTGAVSSDWNDPANWSPAAVPGASSDVAIATGDAVASASIGTVNSIADSSDLSFESAGMNTVATFLNDTGHLRVDHEPGEGGTTLNIGGTLTNSNHLVICNAGLSASDEVTAAALDNTGKVYLTGSASAQALLDVTGSAGFGTAGELSGYVRLAGDSAIEFGGGEITNLAAGAHLGLSGNDAFVEDSSAPGSNSALSGLASIDDGALFALHDGAAVSTSGALVNDGDVDLDTGDGDGGSSVTVGGTLTNSGNLGIGNRHLSASAKVTAASLDNAGGGVRLLGSSDSQALLDVTGSAGFGDAGTLSGLVRLAGDSAIEFASGEITSLADQARLYLTGDDAFIEDTTALGSNSALTDLATIGQQAAQPAAVFDLENGASVSTTGGLVNNGYALLDDESGHGGSSLNIGGALTNKAIFIFGNSRLSASDEVRAASLDNTGSIFLNGSSTNQVLLNVSGSAGFGTAGVLGGNVELTGDTAIEFADGQIASLAGKAQLLLNGDDALIEDSTGLGSNSALEGLASIGAGATFDLENGASVSTTGALVNDGTASLDTYHGGSSLTVWGTLTNSGTLGIGNDSLSAADEVTAASLDNTGSISIAGSSANEALLDVTMGVAGFGTARVASGVVQLFGDTAITFGSGEITSLAAHAKLSLNGNDAFIEDSTALGSNSALTGLASIGADAAFELANGASVSTSGALDNVGFISLDYSNTSTIIDEGGSSLTVGGTLTNTGGLLITSSPYGLRASDTVTAAALDNTGSITVSGYFGHQALVDVTTGVAGFGTAGTLTGFVELYAGAIEFLSGQINTIGKGGSLVLYGDDAFIEDSTALGSNSALTGLSNVSGGLDIEGGGAVSTQGGLVNSGFVNLAIFGAAPSLNIGGALINTGTVRIGVGGTASSASVSATSLVNRGQIYLDDDETNPLDVSGATTNNGLISIESGAEEFAGAVGGAGYFSLYDAIFEFDSSVSAGQTINAGAAGALTLGQAQSFAATISYFGTGDTIDAANFLFSGTKFNFVENSGGTGGTLTLHDGSLTANIHMTGDYSKSDFALAHDSGTGTLVNFS